MSELIQENSNCATIRWKLMASVSAVALIASSFAADEALAADVDSSRPSVWIELGAQLERAIGGDGAFVPPFYSGLDPSFSSPTNIQSALPWALGPEGKITLQPPHSNWVFSAAVRYGRAKNHRSDHQATKPGEYKNVQKYQLITPTHHYTTFKCCKTNYVTPFHKNFTDDQSTHAESHLILDFQAGKDVGLGLFGDQGTSTISAGIRFAQFTTKSSIAVKAVTGAEHFNALPYKSIALLYYPQKYVLGTAFRAHSLTAASSRSFGGIGPSLSWEGSAAVAGNSDSSELTFDWGINAALLFGKQKAETSHQSSAHFQSSAHPAYSPLYTHPPKHYTRSRSVTVPNVGGMAGLSIKWPNAKVSMGYRADFFFGAMDGGWDTYKQENRSFMGPFAAISIGLGG